MPTCQNIQHRTNERFTDLPDSQEFFGEPERWKCVGCAYDQGYNDAVNGDPKGIRLAALPQSQAGTGRHKDPTIAYEWGYGDGLRSLEHDA
jgi:hypothetical protein